MTCWASRCIQSFMDELQRCLDCGASLYRMGKLKCGLRRYQCPTCFKYHSDYYPFRQILAKDREEKLLFARARREAKTLAEFLKTLRPDNDTSGVENYFRRSFAAQRLGVSRQRIHQKITSGQLKIINVAGIDWVEVT